MNTTASEICTINPQFRIYWFLKRESKWKETSKEIMRNQSKVRVTIIATTAMIALAALAQTVREVSVRSMAPSVVKTVPESGTTDVDPALTEVKVTFSKDMITDRMWSVCQISNETFPEVGGIHYLPDKRTCVVPVKLQAGKTYVLWFNNGKFNAFRDTERHSSIPYMLVFETKK